MPLEENVPKQKTSSLALDALDTAPTTPSRRRARPNVYLIVHTQRLAIFGSIVRETFLNPPKKKQRQQPANYDPLREKTPSRGGR
jgi:hypothetical protein